MNNVTSLVRSHCLAIEKIAQGQVGDTIRYKQKNGNVRYPNQQDGGIKNIGKEKAMTTLKRIMGVIALLVVPYNAPATAQQESLVATYEQPTQTAQDEVTYEQVEVAQEIDYSAVWLDGQVSFLGGELSSSERQLAYTKANAIPLISSNADYWELVRRGYLVSLRHPDLEVGAKRPHVLPTTARFIYEIAEQFRTAGCGRLRINDATRLVSERPKNGSPYSVHPAGMALDVRVINLSERCYAELNRLLHTAEAELQADVTREYKPEHFHVVVIPYEEVRFIQLQAQYQRSDGQSN